jgi:SOS-response transcriptional repressor LexA
VVKVEGAEGSRQIEALRHRLGLSQTALARELNVSAMAISRWERGMQRPPANANIQLGNLAGNPGCWSFWDRAGLHRDDVIRVLPKNPRFLGMPVSDLEIVEAGVSRISKKKQLVTIPVLPVTVATHGGKGDPALSLDQSRPESVLAAPIEWCPNPSDTTCLRVQGRSMMPLLNNGYIVAVDTSQTDRRTLTGQVVIAENEGQGLIVSRFQRFGSTEVLIPENREYDPTALLPDWRVVGKVLWWIGYPS